MLMSRAKFAARFEQFQAWKQKRDAAQHINMWQSGGALSVLSSLDQEDSSDLHELKTSLVVEQVV